MLAQIMDVLRNLMIFAGSLCLLFALIKFASGQLQGGLDGADQTKALGALGAGALLLGGAFLVNTIDISWIAYIPQATYFFA